MNVKVRVNGELREVKEGTSVLGLLEELSLAGKPVVVEWNEQPLLPREFDQTRLSEQDAVEIVQITAGG